MKRILALALCLLLCPAALAEVYIMNYYGTEEDRSYNLLITDAGEALTPPGTYDTIYEITPEGTPEGERLYSATPCDLGVDYTPELAETLLYSTDYPRVALMGPDGRLLTDYEYNGLDYANGYVIFTMPDGQRHTGAMDARGNVVVEPEYAALKPVGEGRWLAMAWPEGVDTDPASFDEFDFTLYRFSLLLIDSDGSTRDLGLHTTDRYWLVSPDGISTLWEVEEYGGQTVFVDSHGEVMFGRGFQRAEQFIGNYAIVETETGFGLIDRDGDYAVDPVYDYISGDAGRPFIATKGTRIAIYAEGDGELLFDEDFAPAADVGTMPISPDLFQISVDEKRLIYDGTGALVLEAPDDSYIQSYFDIEGGVSRLVLETGSWPGDKVALTDLEGNVICDGYRAINCNRWREGHAQFIVFDYDLYEDSEGDAMVDWSSYRYGLIDEDGNVLQPMVYDMLLALDFDRYWAVQGERRGMIDSAGKWYYSVSDYEALMD